MSISHLIIFLENFFHFNVTASLTALPSRPFFKAIRPLKSRVFRHLTRILICASVGPDELPEKEIKKILKMMKKEKKRNLHQKNDIVIQKFTRQIK